MCNVAYRFKYIKKILTMHGPLNVNYANNNKKNVFFVSLNGTFSTYALWLPVTHQSCLIASVNYGMQILCQYLYTMMDFDKLFSPPLRRALYMIQLIKSFSCCWKLNNIVNDSDLNQCRIAHTFTWEYATSVPLHAAVWYLPSPYTTTVHGAEKITSLKETNREVSRV